MKNDCIDSSTCLGVVTATAHAGGNLAEATTAQSGVIARKVTIRNDANERARRVQALGDMNRGMEDTAQTIENIAWVVGNVVLNHKKEGLIIVETVLIMGGRFVIIEGTVFGELI